MSTSIVTHSLFLASVLVLAGCRPTESAVGSPLEQTGSPANRTVAEENSDRKETQEVASVFCKDPEPRLAMTASAKIVQAPGRLRAKFELSSHWDGPVDTLVALELVDASGSPVVSADIEPQGKSMNPACPKRLRRRSSIHPASHGRRESGPECSLRLRSELLVTYGSTARTRLSALLTSASGPCVADSDCGVSAFCVLDHCVAEQQLGCQVAADCPRSVCVLALVEDISSAGAQFQSMCAENSPDPAMAHAQSTSVLVAADRPKEKSLSAELLSRLRNKETGG